MSDPVADFKAAQRKSWSSFAPLQEFTTPPAASLVAFAQIKPGARALDVACGTGVVAVTLARSGAQVDALDLTPALLEVGRENAAIARVKVAFVEGDVEHLPYPDTTFDAVLSQFGHMFAPRPEVAIGEMLRVLKPGGTLAFNTWPPELFVGRLFALTAKYSPPPPPGVSPPTQWGDPNVIRERLGSRVKALTFDRGVALRPSLSVAHDRVLTERTAGPIKRLVETAEGSAQLEEYRREYEELTSEYFDNALNVIRHGFLMTRAIKT